LAGECGSARGLGDVLRPHHVQALELLTAGLVHHRRGVDAVFRALQRPLDRGRIADIGLDDLNLADIAQQPQAIGLPGAANGDADAPAGLGQHPHALAADEPRAAEDRHQALHHAASSRPTREAPG
jgi:hypothetical protein